MGFFSKIPKLSSPDRIESVGKEMWDHVSSTQKSSASFNSTDVSVQDKGAVALLATLSGLGPSTLLFLLYLFSVLYSMVIISFQAQEKHADTNFSCKGL